MNNMKKMIIIISIIIVILIITLVGLLRYVSKNPSNKDTIEVESEESTGDLYNYNTVKTQEVEDATSFYTVAQCISNYFEMINLENPLYYGTDEEGKYARVISDNDIALNVLNILDKSYITKNNINDKNMTQFIEMSNKKQIFIPLKMNILPDRIAEKYAVYGFTQDIEYNYIKDYYFIVTLDIKNYTYTIEPLKNNYKDINEIKLENTNTEIKANDNNQYDAVKVDNEYIANKYLENYKRMLLGNTNLAYQYLNNEYRTKKYGNVENFKNQIEKQKDTIKTISLSKYSTEIREKYKQYVCIDQKGNYYIFQETAPMQYTVMLDTYTIDLPEFIQKYSNSSDEQKVLLNIQKIFEAINSQDYEYVYNKLDQTFKANNFSTLQDFENYANKNFFAQNKVVAGKAEKQSDVYIYNLNITDASGNNKNAINKNFVMKLKEGTDFVMSFSIN